MSKKKDDIDDNDNNSTSVSNKVVEDQGIQQSSLIEELSIIIKGDNKKVSDESKKQIGEEIRKYSITPETRQKSIFDLEHLAKEQEAVRLELERVEKKKQVLEQNLHQLENSIESLDQSFSEASKITGIDADYKQFDTKTKKDIQDLATKIPNKTLSELSKYKNELEQYQKYLGNKDFAGELLTFEESYAFKNQSTIRFGINTPAMSEKTNSELAKIYTPTEKKSGSTKSPKSGKSNTETENPKLLTPIEIFNMRKAIDQLNELKSPIKSVVVDIFARNDDGSINLTQNKKIETHAVVLYKQIAKNISSDNNAANNKEQIFIIDPSNSDFSKHVAFNSLRLFLNKDETKQELLAPNKLLKIYETPAKIEPGPEKDQFRDCIDIAVKLAFGFNKNQETLDIKNLASLKVVQEVTNALANAEFLPDFIKTTAVRSRQASDENIRKEVKIFMEAINNQQQSLSLYPGGQQKISNLKSDYKKIGEAAFSCSEYNKYLQSLKNKFSSDSVEFVKFIANYTTELTEIDILGNLSNEANHDN